ncbi:hypothetical protein CcaverHIS002_0300350 [Cutaneotrichosporon cavernicola]|uniref:NADH dehydrogenase [ubiquinone] 1 beta subcomplex subunit 11, mitochondrial n=1 Tax=Cutaneotrichosporon cavernicola TaxID=279322 RepID=A0AA48I8W5_9TREE|nr:uncharacterized protein CcaverHIS019_0300350 [Cutaneotrichosporon cavernicola]BEI82167.1 hypothetical protein CcaverHIS002_0300350 [Cutaneotrichosporon cavernicola]BEI89965.1 hypothetical protein CcaverHIS019_0300350 [Cutaneotrichosporon cavernicola]BEI97738.1 hypothetical protein CcaverHIS631_0300370 [Cutaneotrichosporon cavernicola]BEJ05515.1 hypothetical protein CcaverHIS641_0300370 [Cutaneotrichosporon cavernicola]
MLRQAARPLARAARPVQVRYGSTPHYNQPSGYVFSEEIGPGQKRVRESWETIFYTGFFGGLALAAAIIVYKPDTSIQAWALQEAKQRMEARGEPTKYTSPSQ